MPTTILHKESLIPGRTSKLVLDAPQIAATAKPGHFVMLRVNEQGERFPLTIADTDPEKGTITIVYLVMGKSTMMLEALSEGDSILDVAGPLGKATHIVKGDSVICVGGGTGIAAMHHIAKGHHKAGNYVIAIIGAVMVVLANPLFRAIGSFIDRRRSINDYETVGHEYTFEVRCLQQHEVKIRSLVFDAVHRPGFSVRSIAATDLPDDIVSITAVLDTTKRNDADIEKSIEAVIQTPEVLGVRWDVEHITTSD